MIYECERKLTLIAAFQREGVAFNKVRPGSIKLGLLILQNVA